MENLVAIVSEKPLKHQFLVLCKQGQSWQINIISLDLLNSKPINVNHDEFID